MEGKPQEGDAQSVVIKSKMKRSIAAYPRSKKFTINFSRRHQWTLGNYLRIYFTVTKLNIASIPTSEHWTIPAWTKVPEILIS